jgi:alkyl sulfatase BDS1-like metallo-beta-lactamase superfamily hydrolase
MELSNGALIHYPMTTERTADLAVTLTKMQLIGLLASGSLEGIDMSGDTSVLPRLLAVTDDADPDFAIVTP